MENVFNPIGASSASKPTSGGANIRSVPVFGVVKNNIDPVRSGRIQVYIADFGSNDPNDASAWSTLSYMSPFFGSIQPKAPNTGYGDYVSNPSSYGFWNSPPDIGSTVICLFINGDPSYGFYIGCVPTAEALHMVPAIGASENIIANNLGEANGYGGATRLPVTNINTNNVAMADGANFLNEPKPVHSYAAAIFSQQGLIRDPLRGPISTSAQRETPSRVGWGVSTPGRPIYEGGYTDDSIVKALDGKTTGDIYGLNVIARRGGHSIVMDDGDIIGRDQLIRIRTSAGHQITMSDDGQTLFIIHSNGQSYVELGKEGTIDMYSTNSFNVRTQGDINLHSDNNFNINSKKKLNIRAESINIETEKEMMHKVGTDYTSQTKGNYTHKVDGSMSMAASGPASYVTSNLLTLLGSKINLNSGGPSVVPQLVPSIPLVAHTDTLYDSVKGYAAAPGALQSIVSRAPAHAPWSNAGQGVDVKTTSNASSTLPAPASGPLAATNTTSASSPPSSPVKQSVASTTPSAPATSAAIDAPTTNAMVAAQATNAATGDTKTAVATGAGVISTPAGLTASIGAFGATPVQIEAANVLKPGAGAFIDSLVKSGATLKTAMTSNLFTGLPGAQNLSSFVQNIPAQVTAQVANFQQAQTALTNASVMTGKESPVAIAGVVMAGATAGISKTIDAVKGIASQVSLPSAGTSGVADGISNAIASGNFAAKAAQATSGGIDATAFSGPAGALKTAFETITKSFKPLLVGVPQNLETIAKRAAGLLPSGADISGLAGSAFGSLSSTFGKLTKQIKQAPSSSSLSSPSASTQTFDDGSSIQTFEDGSTLVVDSEGTASSTDSTASQLTTASGVGSLPGGKDSITVNASSLPKMPGITALINNSVTAATNNISIQQSITGLTANISGTASGVIGQVGKSTSSAVASLPSAASDLSKMLPGSAAAAQKEFSSAALSLPAATAGLLTGLNKTLDSIKSSSLSSFAMEGLSPADTSKINAAVAALTSSGSIPIKTPIIGVDTNDRSEVSSQIRGLLGDAKIPVPTFGTGPSNASKSAVQKSIEDSISKAKIQTVITTDIFKLKDQLAIAQQKYDNVSSTLPQGSPEIATAKEEIDRLQIQIADKESQIPKSDFVSRDLGSLG